jgi:hypothetical protein
MNRVFLFTAMLTTTCSFLACGGEPQSSDPPVARTSQAISFLDGGTTPPGIVLYTGPYCTGAGYPFAGQGAINITGYFPHGVQSYALGSEDGFLGTSTNPVHHQDEPFGTREVDSGVQCLNGGYYAHIASWLVLTD